MKRICLALILFFFPLFAQALAPGEEAFQSVRTCIMQNDGNFCRSILTPESVPIFDKFSSYKLMPCLPTDFAYISEEKVNDKTVVKATMPAGGGQIYIIHLVFVDMGWSLKLDLPSTFARGLGADWKSKTDMAEQVYLLMKQNMGDKLNCDMLSGLIKPH